jgi:heme-degrading monooxygenase HmoA
MIIGEAFHEDQVAEFAGIYHSEVLPRLQSAEGFKSANLMIEDGGRMAVSLTVWGSRKDCLNYHSSLAYREFVERTRHLLKGDFVVKLFRTV